MKRMSTINRISAWILMVCFMIYMLTGLDTLKRVAIPQISSLIHLKYLFIPAQAAFTFHSSYAIGQSLLHGERWNVVSKALLAIYVLANLILMGFYILTLD
ncbi:MAG TPA: hypothetical protein DIT32_02695 [Peptococcaceae bacterium]|nr:hypothetical protein [Peptococcaceae bacterium]